MISCVLVHTKDLVSQPSGASTWISIRSEAQSFENNDINAVKAHFKNRLNVKNSHHPIIELITSERGTITYEVPESGEVSACIRATAATATAPMRFGIQMSKEDEAEAHDKGKIEPPENSIDQHLTHMEIEMKHLQTSMRNIISEADFSKQRETRFHHQTLSMHAASMWWPIVQVCVLLLTGFTQANHVVRLLKSKRLV